MKRDLELVRKLILAVEALPGAYSFDALKVEGYTDEQVGYHAYLIVDAGLAKGIDQTGIDSKSPYWHILHLTSAGHDFADASRNDATWRKATKLVAEKAGSTTLEIVKEVLGKVVKDTLGLP